MTFPAVLVKSDLYCTSHSPHHSPYLVLCIFALVCVRVCLCRCRWPACLHAFRHTSACVHAVWRQKPGRLHIGDVLLFLGMWHRGLRRREAGAQGADGGGRRGRGRKPRLKEVVQISTNSVSNGEHICMHACMHACVRMCRTEVGGGRDRIELGQCATHTPSWCG